MKLLIDMNLSLQWVSTLRAAGIEAVHWSSVGIGDAPDSEIMAYALAANYVILTRDLGFGAMLARSRASGPSTVQIRADKAKPGLIAARVIEVLRTMADDLAIGAFVSIDLNQTRLRVLPFR